MIASFEPIVNENSRVLLLGTMPGVRSLELGQYYGHKGNQFWKIIFSLFDEPFTENYELRKKILLKNGIALWDILKHCERKGAADSRIKNEIPNDFEGFFKTYPNVKDIFLTSKKAENYFDKYIGKRAGFQYHLLPSPSRANTWKTFDEKINAWKVILNV